MTTRLTVEQADEILRSAFRPLVCGVSKIDRWGHKLRFKVFDENGNPLLDRPEVPAATATNSRLLSELIQDARQELESKGVTLDPWTFPGATP